MAYFGCICLYFLFAGFSNVVKWWSVFVCIVFWVQNCVSFYYENCLSITIEKIMARSDKRVFCLFLFNWKWEMMPTFLFRFFVLFLSFWLFGSKLILLDWRLQDYYGNFGKVSSRQGLQSYHKSFFFEWIIWWWS